jgi:hypothetical protein
MEKNKAFANSITASCARLLVVLMR